MAPANTGRERRSRIAVKSTDHANNGINSSAKPSPRILVMVVIKLALPRMLLTPAR